LILDLPKVKNFEDELVTKRDWEKIF